jgi:hypothetical protein
MAVTDLSRIRDHVLKENYLTMLGFPTAGGRGYVPLRVRAREFFYAMYDPILEGQISSNVPADTAVGTTTNNGISDLGWVNPQQLGSSYMTGKPNNAFYVENENIVYQLFYGQSPSILRTFLEAPAATGQRNLDIDHWGANRAQFGWLDGFDSPLLNPSPQTELIVPPQFNFAIGYANPGPTAVNPLLLFIVNKLEVEVIKNPLLVSAMLSGKVPCAIKTIGGLTTFNYNVQGIYGIDPIPLGSTDAAIAAALGVKLPSGVTAH